MSLGEIDWGILRGSLVLLLVSVLVSGAVLSGGYYFSGAMTAEYQRKNTQLRSIRSKYQTVDEEERVIELFLPRFEALESEGIIGREHRLNWIEKLREASQTLKLPGLRYTIATQETFKPDFDLDTGKFEVFVSRMILNLGLLHEGDLLRLFQELDRSVNGLYSISDCSMWRVRPDFGPDPTEANLTASCTLEWFTIKQGEA